MISAKYLHAAVATTDPKVLVIGGGPNPLSSVEVWDPETQGLEAFGALTTSRQWHTVTRLADGRILVVGGTTITGSLPTMKTITPPSTPEPTPTPIQTQW